MERWKDFCGALGLLLAHMSEGFTTRMFCPVFFSSCYLPGPLSSPCVTHTWSPSLPESCLCSLGVPVCSFLSYLALSGSGPISRSQPTIRARPAPEHQLVVKGEEGECVRPSLCLSASIGVSVCVCISLTNRFNVVALRLETSEQWVVFSSRKQRTPFMFTSHIMYSISLIKPRQIQILLLCFTDCSGLYVETTCTEL